jgi:hypothetical protein
MRKKDFIVDAIAASSTQAISIATITNPVTSIACVTSVAVIAGMTKEFLRSRELDITELADELVKPDVAKGIKAMEEQQFIDDMYYSVDKILHQRTEPKRVLMRNVFLGYLKAEHKSSYPLEKMYKVVENLTFADADMFRKVLKADKLRTESKLPWVSLDIMKGHNTPDKLQKDMMVLTSTDNPQEQQSISSLIDEGLLSKQMRGVGNWSAGEGTPQLYITKFGRYFTIYLLKIKEL